MFARVDHCGDGSIQITSRQGKTFPQTAMKVLSDDMRWTVPTGTQTHGELTVWRDGVLQTRAIGNGILNRLQNDGEELTAGDEVRFDAWDQIPLSMAVPKGNFSTPYQLRLEKLKTQIQAAGRSSIMVIETRLCHSEAEAQQHYREVLAQGLEGTVCKHPNAEWRDGDSKDQVKFKLEVDVDLEIVGFNKGTEGKRTQDTFGSVRCRTSDGLLQVDVSGFTRDMEKFLHENRESVMHKIMCVRANEISKPSESNELHSLLHPRVVEIRDDKYEADDLPSVLAQFEAAIA